MTQEEYARELLEANDGWPTVYCVRIGKLVKIGHSTKLKLRLAAFRNASASVELLAAIPGDQKLERRIHAFLKDECMTRELFNYEHRVHWFIETARIKGPEEAIKYLEESTAEKIKNRQIYERGRRDAARRKTKAEKDAHFASLVAERKQRIGW